MREGHPSPHQTHKHAVGITDAASLLCASWVTGCLLGLHDFSAAQAGSANAHSLGRLAHARMDWAQVDVPTPLAHVVRVADRVPTHRLLAADFTDLCHDTASPEIANLDWQSFEYIGFEALYASLRGHGCNFSRLIALHVVLPWRLAPSPYSLRSGTWTPPR